MASITDDRIFRVRRNLSDAGCDGSFIEKFLLLVECNPFFQQRELRGLLEQSNVKIEAYRPLGHGALPCFLIPSSRKLQKNTKKMPAR